MSSAERFNGTAEDPLAGDVDTFVHSDETMSEEEREIAEKYPLEAWSEDSSENYWADYDELHGTINGGEKPKAKMVTLGEGHGYDTEIVTSSGMRVATTKRQLAKEYPGMTTQEIADAMDLDREESDAEFEELQARMDAEDQAAWEDDYPYEDDSYDEPDEDPLAGDVDRWVHEDETKD